MNLAAAESAEEPERPARSGAVLAKPPTPKAALIAAVAALITALIAARAGARLRLREEKFVRGQEDARFLTEKLTRLYLPMTMYLGVTQALFRRFFETNDTTEQTAIEHALRDTTLRCATCCFRRRRTWKRTRPTA
ncbi:MAG: hypothetical protein HC841_05395 [Verrucomicrobiae bacterium]|nr:hypothetical protein [Verrucomicrobiae bacterium]